ncbi:ribonuclease H-like domain-containing protein [Tanacetum coccineum]|uniref:Ribonuclease H-like domain-containing protein n=1 Tax=Tanacetum coccineum TaxID=301880 RepID=A0ABQ4X6E7_9ASTR
MEALYATIRKTMDLGLFKGVSVRHANLIVSHLMYADDVFFWGEWSKSNMQNLLCMLRCFYLVSELKINVHKSNIIGVFVSNEIVNSMAKIIGCGVANFPLKKSRLLSVGGRISLINSVLGNLPTYYMSLYMMPVSIQHKLEMMRNKFFIGGDKGEKKLTWVKWKKYLASKDLGGLGVGSIFDLNLGLLFKWLWRFRCHSNDLWANVIISLYGSNGGINEERVHTHGSWGVILSSVNRLKHIGIDLLALCNRKIGNGALTSFWNKAWSSASPLKNLYPRIYMLDSDKGRTVSSRLNGCDWSSVLRRPPRGGVELLQFIGLMSSIGEVALSCFIRNLVVIEWSSWLRLLHLSSKRSSFGRGWLDSFVVQFGTLRKPANLFTDPPPIEGGFMGLPMGTLKNSLYSAVVQNQSASSGSTSQETHLRTAFNTRIYPSVLVGDGKSISVTNTGHSTLPTPYRTLHLNNVLITPNIVKNLISSRLRRTLSRYKARLVANGSTQLVGIDVDETFSLVIKPATIRILLNLAISRHWLVHQLDVKNAFLHGSLSETVYMHQPPGFWDLQHPDHVCLLQRSLYGLKQTPRAWFQRFAAYAAWVGFHHSRCDSSLFIYRQGADTAYLHLYVDDIVLTASSSDLLQQIITSLHAEFSMTDLGSLNYFLGIFVTHNGSGMFLSQQKYATEVLDRAGMLNCKPCHTHVDTDSKLSADGAPISDSTLYRSLAEALQYLTFTRPDISYVVQQLYSSKTSSLVAYSDADWRQFTLSRSSAKAEYRGVANAVAETCWLRNLLRELHTPLATATLVYCDNVSVVYLFSNPVQHQRTKHIEIDIYFVRDLVATGAIRVLHVP